MPAGIARTRRRCYDNNTFSCVADVRAIRRHRSARPGPDGPILADGRDLPPAPRRTRRRPQQLPGLSRKHARGRFLRVPQLSQITTDDKALASFILDRAGVANLGGSCFGEAGTGYLRFSYATSLEEINFALERMAEALPHFPG